MILKYEDHSYHPCLYSNRQKIRFIDITKPSSIVIRQSRTSLCVTSVPVDVIGASDILDGTLIALVLAFTASYLQGRRNSDDVVLSEVSKRNITSSSTVVDHNDSLSSESVTFDADSWEEISRPESYIFYKQRLRDRELKSSSQSSFDSEKMWAIFALLALFVPIFSVEFFFALSRQFICGGDPMYQSDWSEFLCSPAMTNFE